MYEYAKRIPKESIVEIKGKVSIPDKPVQGCTQKAEVHVIEIWTVNKSAPILPFQIEDASRKVENQEAERDANPGEKHEEEKKSAVVKQDVRLNNRIIDLRVPAN